MEVVNICIYLFIYNMEVVYVYIYIYVYCALVDLDNKLYKKHVIHQKMSRRCSFVF